MIFPSSFQEWNEGGKWGWKISARRRLKVISSGRLFFFLARERKRGTTEGLRPSVPLARERERERRQWLEKVDRDVVSFLSCSLVRKEGKEKRAKLKWTRLEKRSEERRCIFPYSLSIFTRCVFKNQLNRTKLMHLFPESTTLFFFHFLPRYEITRALFSDFMWTEMSCFCCPRGIF